MENDDWRNNEEKPMYYSMAYIEFCEIATSITPSIDLFKSIDNITKNIQLRHCMKSVMLNVFMEDYIDKFTCVSRVTETTKFLDKCILYCEKNANI